MTSAALPPSQETGQWLRNALPQRSDRALFVTMSAPMGCAEALLEGAEHASFWSTAEETVVGLGEAQVFMGEGDSRFTQVSDAAQQLKRLHTIGMPGAPHVVPRAFGGFAFQPGSASESPWLNFGDARFVVPRMMYRQAAGHASLSFIAQASELKEAGTSTLLKRVAGIHTRLTQARVTSSPGLALVGVNEVNRPAWSRLINNILEQIRSQQCLKVVAARRTDLSYSQPLQAAATLLALAEHSSRSTRFAFRFGGSTFVGATPERLIQKSGQDLATEALAGTFRLTDSELKAELLRSPKEHEEHAPVLQAIVERLRPLCSNIEFPAEPEICELKHLLHLRSSVNARLSSPTTDILQLVELLHPTPAVGGVPTASALRWIAQQEHHARGWYAAPVGWFNGSGDGSFDVALRSGVLDGRQAHLYAGAGIVSGSHPDSEFAETELKLRALKASLRG